MSEIDDASILITGGTGSLGKALIEYLLSETKVRRIAIYSRDELKQSALRFHLFRSLDKSHVQDLITSYSEFAVRTIHHRP